MKEFNLVVTGVGGQGILTLANIIGEAAVKQGYDVKISELHGLSQRGGHIECHVRFGKNINSSLVREGKADLIIALEPVEGLRTSYYASKENTVFLVNTLTVVPLSVRITHKKYPSLDEVVEDLKSFSNKIITLNASDIVKSETGNIVSTNVYMLGYASSRDMIPIKKEFLFDGIRKIIPEKYFEMNKKIFELASRR